MSEPILETKKGTAYPLPVNYFTGIFLLVFLIPLGYTFFANLQSPPPPAVIEHAVKPAPVVTVTPAQQLESALKAVAAKPGADTYINLGMIYYTQGNYEESIKSWKKAVEYNPKNEIAYNDIAAAFGALHQWDNEINAAKKALSINPDFDLAKRNLAWATSKKNGK